MGASCTLPNMHLALKWNNAERRLLSFQPANLLLVWQVLSQTFTVSNMADIHNTANDSCAFSYEYGNRH